MISPDELRKKLVDKYRKFLKDVVNGNSMFPYRPRVNLDIDLNNFSDALRQIQGLEEQSKAKCGYGYTINYTTVRTRKYGDQTRPSSIIFETPEDLFRFIRKNREAKDFFNAVDEIRKGLPVSKNWISANIPLIQRYRETWSDIIRTVLQLVKLHADIDLSQMNNRSLPITLDTKFIERNRTPIQKILEEIGTDSIDLDSPIFSSDFLVWVRFQDSAYSFFNAKIGIFPVEEFAAMEVPVDQVLVIENKACFTAPLPHIIFSAIHSKVPATTLLVWGSGNACQRLREVTWLNTKKLYYWGDMDLDGLAILGGFRRLFPHTRSIGMDMKTYRTCVDFAVPGNLLDRGSWYDFLSPAEKELADYLITNPDKSRVEQERIG